MAVDLGPLGRWGKPEDPLKGKKTKKFESGMSTDGAVFENGAVQASTRDTLQQAALGALGTQTQAPQAQAASTRTGQNAGRQGQQIDQGATNYGQLLGLGARGQQQDALALQQQAAMGQAPSVAAIQQQQGLDAALSSQFAMANSARGGAAQRAAAQAQAGMQAGQLQQQAVGQAAALRAGEMAQARDAFAAGAGAIRQGDLGQSALAAQLATDQAGLLQQQQLANQQVVADARMQDAQLQQAAALANQGATLQQQQLDTQRQLGLMGALTAADQLQLNAQLGSQDQYLQLLGLKSGAARERETQGRAQANAVFGGVMNAAGGALGIGG